METQNGHHFIKVGENLSAETTVSHFRLFSDLLCSKNLATFVRTHEKALANALQLHRQAGRHGPTSPGSPRSSHSTTSQNSSSSSTTSSIIAAALSLSYLNFTSHLVKPVKLTLTPHHLFYLLSKFEEMGIAVGAMNIRLENIHSESSPANYVSFLSSAQRKKARSSDRDSLHSVSSVRSVISGMSAIWSNLGLSPDPTAKTEKAKLQLKEDLKYLYSAFTKLPCLKLAPDHKAHLIAGYEEFPFDSAVPLFVFKNLSALEITDIDFRHFYGWDRIAEQLRSLTIKRGAVDDPADLIVNIVLDDIDKRRRRSSKSVPSPVMPLPTPGSSRNVFGTCSDSIQSTSSSCGRPDIMLDSAQSLGAGPALSPGVKGLSHRRNRSVSPPRPSSSTSMRGHSRSSTPMLRRSSGSSNSSIRMSTPRTSSSNLLAYGSLPSTKWRFLKHLSLADNALTTLPVFGLVPLANTLQSLDLSSNLFTEIPESLAALSSLRALNLSNCMIHSLHSMIRNPIPAITALNLRGNRLQSLAGIERLPSLERLDLRENKLNDPMDLARLNGSPNLRELFLLRNPFTKSHPNYRVIIFNIFRTTPGYSEDIIIDGRLPLHNEKKHLADRAPEPTIVPSLRSHLEQSMENSTGRAVKSMDRPRSPWVKEDKENDSDSLRTIKTTYRAQSQRRRKVTKRRIVDLLHSDDKNTSNPHPQEPSASMSETRGPHVPRSGAASEATATEEHHPVQGYPNDANPPILELLHPIEKRIAPTATDNEAGAAIIGDSTTKDEGDLYRRKIEALRNDFGDSWLSALSEQTWDNQPHNAQFSDRGSLLARPVDATASSRSPAQSILSVGKAMT